MGGGPGSGSLQRRPAGKASATNNVRRSGPPRRQLVERPWPSISQKSAIDPSGSTAQMPCSSVRQRRSVHRRRHRNRRRHLARGLDDPRGCRQRAHAATATLDDHDRAVGSSAVHCRTGSRRRTYATVTGVQHPRSRRAFRRRVVAGVGESSPSAVTRGRSGRSDPGRRDVTVPSGRELQTGRYLMTQEIAEQPAGNFEVHAAVLRDDRAVGRERRRSRRRRSGRRPGPARSATREQRARRDAGDDQRASSRQTGPSGRDAVGLTSDFTRGVCDYC